MEYPNHEDMKIDIEKLKEFRTNQNSINKRYGKKIDKLYDKYDMIEERMNQSIQDNRVDRAHFENLMKIVKSIDSNLKEYVQETREEVKELKKRMSSIEKDLAVNDYKTSKTVSWINEIDKFKLAIIVFFLTTIFGMIIEKVL
jgi:uncharacterized coiled-coil DUF342 family protein